MTPQERIGQVLDRWAREDVADALDDLEGVITDLAEFARGDKATPEPWQTDEVNTLVDQAKKALSVLIQNAGLLPLVGAA